MKDFIKETWDKQASQYKDSHWASWGDEYAINLEIENIAQYIKEGDTVLDIGCANGYSTFKQLARKPGKITGVDFSEEMIFFAEEKRKESPSPNIEFKVGDIRKLEFADNTFDVTYTTRVLINLPTWEEQMNGIDECIRVTKRGGTVILSEAFWEPLILLNSIRAIKGLQPLVEHDFNRYLKKANLEKILTDRKLKFTVNDFSSVYYLGSRFLRELVTKIDDYPGYSNPINEVFYNLERQFSGGGFGIQQAYIITK